MKIYNIGVNRVLEVGDDGVIIKDTVTSAEAVFSKVRWATFLTLIDDIDAEVKKLKEVENAEFSYCMHYGGGWQVSVTGGIRCVDLRRFFVNEKYDTRPTRHGIGLRLREWQTLKEVIQFMRDDAPELMSTRGCVHDGPLEWFNCRECFAFLNPQKQ